jgi:hypothetical protein
MPLEIRELVIRASVQGGEDGQTSMRERGGNYLNDDERADIIAACVAQVFALLKEQSER